MAHLGNGKVEVDRPRNENRMGDSGRRARSKGSAYLLVGGSSDTYSVTVNFDSGHFCKKDHDGEPCKGNLYGKKGKYGAINARNTNNPEAWCKHVQAALADAEAVAEAQEITASAFGATPRVEPKPEPAPEPEPVATWARNPRNRLAEIEAEREAIKADLGVKVAALVAEYGPEAVTEALKAA